MALINDLYVLVTDENISRNTDIPSHPTESGMPLSDFVRKNPIGLSLTGSIVFVPNGRIKEVSDIINKLKYYQNNGSLVTYVGQCGKITNLLIESFNTDYNNKINGGANFDMSLKEVRVAKKAYRSEKTTVKTLKEKIPLKVGNEVKFTGGNVYVASDSINPSSQRGGSVCKLTKISDLATRKHIYHLISTDGAGVYGWVDAKNVKEIEKTEAPRNSGGLQTITITEIK